MRTRPGREGKSISEEARTVSSFLHGRTLHIGGTSSFGLCRAAQNTGRWYRGTGQVCSDHCCRRFEGCGDFYRRDRVWVNTTRETWNAITIGAARISNTRNETAYPARLEQRLNCRQYFPIPENGWRRVAGNSGAMLDAALIDRRFETKSRFRSRLIESVKGANARHIRSYLVANCTPEKFCDRFEAQH